VENVNQLIYVCNAPEFEGNMSVSSYTVQNVYAHGDGQSVD
jgi:hypothetical protein